MPVLTAVATDESGPYVAPVVIVGAGTAGISFALEFVKHSTAPLVMIEPGGPAVGSDSPAFLDAVRPENLWEGIRVQCVDNGPVVQYPQARVLGGGSAINGMLAGLPPSDAPMMRAIGWNQAPTGGAESHDEQAGQVGRALLQLGGYRWVRNVEDGRRRDGTSALAEMVESGRLTLIRGEVDSVVFDENKVVGVRVDGRIVDASAVVMCAGAVGTPRVLSRSALPAGVPAQVGAGLMDHPCISFVLHLRDAPPAGIADALVHVGATSLPWAGANIDPARAWRVDTGRPAAAEARTWGSSRASGVIMGYERLSRHDAGKGIISAVLLRPFSRGSVDFSDGVLLRPRMLSHPVDGLAMVGLVRDLIRVAMRPEIAAIATHVTVDDVGTRVTEIAALPDDLLLEWIRSHLSPVAHAVGTCSGLLGNLSDPFGEEAANLTESQIALSEVQARLVSRWREANRQAGIPDAPVSGAVGPVNVPGVTVRGAVGLHIADSSGLRFIPADMINAHVAAHAARVARVLTGAAGGRRTQGRTA
jgi:hypothetical protein